MRPRHIEIGGNVHQLEGERTQISSETAGREAA
jgi:hypothetical protein